jgi:cupin fold WbuC family metalloprotein
MVIIDEKILEQLTKQAKANPRKRQIHNFHKSAEEPIHRMLNALEPETYVRPHKHQNPDKTESFIILKGSVLVLIFNDDGTIKEKIVLKGDQESYGVEIYPFEWHSLISLEEGTVIFETKNGPYDPLSDKKFANWAPAENDLKSIEYMNFLLDSLKIDHQNRP